jgi:Ca2+-binding EF-hand superfamily protein
MATVSVKSRFNEIQAKCLSTGILYEDPEFPAVPKSVYFSKVDQTIQWRRPVELLRQPKFIEDGASRFDLDQGALGDCWFIAAAATLACRPELFKVVVPDDQGYDKNYAGLFHFYFWCFGEWREVIIDDRLPTFKTDRGRQLVFCSNREKPSEFWPALLEKAYAKLFGSYEALEGGMTDDALVDFTGGIGSRMDLTRHKDLPPDLFQRLLRNDKMSTLMGCSINATRSTMENRLTNGLIIGHAYSITRVLEITVNQKKQQLLRLRNPWGQKEWNGAWSDKSNEWLNIDAKTRQELGIVNEEDGEFWISFQDWLDNFQMLQLCHLPPNNSLRDRDDWKEVSFNGSWVRGVNSGGSSRASSDAYWSNSQYCVSLTAPNRQLFAKPGDAQSKPGNGNKSTMIVSLMQKNSRRNRTLYHVQSAEIAMTFDLYKLNTDEVPSNLSSAHFDKNALQLARKGDQYQYFREISDHYLLDPGVYVVIPSTYDTQIQAEYLLRIFTDSGADGSELDTPTEPLRASNTSGENLVDLFNRYAGSDGVIDHRELQMVLNQSFTRELGNDHTFDLETARSLLSMMDRNLSGVMEMAELQLLWGELTTWKNAFAQFDKDKSGYIEVTELKSIFKSVGYNLSRAVLKAIVRRYGGKEGRLGFNDFALAVTKVVSLVEKFPNFSKDGLKGKAELSLDEFLQVIMYF